MPAGLQTWDAAGQPEIDLATRVFRTLQVIPIGVGPGQIEVNASSQGTIRAFVNAGGFTGSSRSRRVVTVSGNRVSWPAGDGAYLYLVAW